MNDSLDPILQQEEQRKLRVQLMWRLGIAAALVAGVLAILAWLDADAGQKPQMTVAAPRDVQIEPPAASSVASQVAVASEPAATPAENTPEASAASSTATTIPETTPTPRASASTPALPVQPQPQVAKTTSQPMAAIATLKPAAPTALPPAKTAAPAQMPLAVKTPKPPVAPVKPTHPALNEPTQPKPENLTRKAAAPAARYPAPVLTPDGYTVQTGVFLHAAKAEQMLKQVQSAGVPVYMETRVQIGPFNSRIEAEAAIQKLRQRGIEPVIKEN